MHILSNVTYFYNKLNMGFKSIGIVDIILFTYNINANLNI